MIYKLFKLQSPVIWEPLRSSKINTDPCLLRNLQKEIKQEKRLPPCLDGGDLAHAQTR